MNLTSILDRASKLRIAVVGDLIEDIYIFGDVTRISPEAPIPILNVTEHRRNWGGAGNVVENLKKLGVEVSFFYNDKHIPKKTRVMCGDHHLIRIDEEDTPKLVRWDDINYGLGYGISRKLFDCVIISDYGKGMINREVADEIISRCTQMNIPTVVDTKHQHNIFFAATLLKSNKKEWNDFITKRGSNESIWEFMHLGDIRNLVITNGERGMGYRHMDDGVELSGNVSGHKIDICDTCGAGDTVTAILGIMMALGEPLVNACELANIAAAEVCRHPGVHPISRQELINRYDLYPNHTSVQPIRLQSNAAEDKGAHQAHIPGENGRGDATDEARKE